MKLVSIKPATDGKHKYTAIFSDPKKTVHFGAKSYNDFTIYSKGDKKIAEEKKVAYIARHRVNEKFDSPATPGSLSRWILWNLPTVTASIADFKKRFNL
tara:strand:+ start:175 stop:471 length:297 start_codon:yes stop_codon:yes gene_type:complete